MNYFRKSQINLLKKTMNLCITPIKSIDFVSSYLLLVSHTAAQNFLNSKFLSLFLMLLTGIPNLITADMIKDGAAVIDVGINRIQDPLTGKDRLVGDVDFEGKDGGKWN